MQSSEHGTIHYWRAWSAFFQNPNWGLNLLLATVCNLIPLLGPIVLYGWLAQVVEELHRHPDLTYPDFRFEHFGDYLRRGIWPFLVVIVCTVAATPVTLLAFAPAFLLLADDSTPMIIFVIVLVTLLYILALLLMGLLIVPLLIRSCLTQSFSLAFSWPFFKDFTARVWPQTLAAALFLLVTSAFAGILGYAMCIIGFYPMIVLITFAAWHLHYQLYELHLAKGGLPIPLHSDLTDLLPAPPHPPVAPAQHGPDS